MTLNLVDAGLLILFLLTHGCFGCWKLPGRSNKTKILGNSFKTYYISPQVSLIYLWRGLRIVPQSIWCCCPKYLIQPVLVFFFFFWHFWWGPTHSIRTVSSSRSLEHFCLSGLYFYLTKVTSQPLLQCGPVITSWI